MNATEPPAGNLYLIVGYDGSPPATRALDAAVRLMSGRSGTIEVVYVAHLPSVDALSPGAVAEMEADFDDIAQELRVEPLSLAARSRIRERVAGLSDRAAWLTDDETRGHLLERTTQLLKKLG